ncbi:hypothetical protein GGD63_004744 [Bradyrhizobium sp. cir1]|uniref:hypothetical protein n=1 Tax=Bradyrhizobium sp. cir1 TaxID=1445730 RepID=UPI00160645D0|nr:hypothetical protein [Bradyrhizobium sp. cir1]MBB4371943.1 hypothetical protein [Bradyrhizobium sp. cir1]
MFAVILLILEDLDKSDAWRQATPCNHAAQYEQVFTLLFRSPYGPSVWKGYVDVRIALVYGAPQPGAQEHREGLRIAGSLNSSKTSSRIMIVPGRRHCLMINPFRELLSVRVQDELFFVARRQ